MRAGFKRLQQRGELDGILKSPTANSSARWIAGALAAAGLAALIIGTIFVQHRNTGATAALLARSLDQLAHSSPAPLVSASYILAHARGVPTVQQISVSRTATPIEIQILPDASAADGRYTVTLQPPEALVKDLQADSSGVVRIFINPAGLVSGEYTFVLTNSGGSQQFPVRIDVRD
jgi:hypothetical protein